MRIRGYRLIGFACAIAFIGSLLWVFRGSVWKLMPNKGSVDQVEEQTSVEGIPPKEWTVYDYTNPPHPHKGPVIQIGCVDEKGEIIQLKSIHIQPAEDRSSRATSCPFEGAQSVQFALVDGPATMRQIRAGIPYEVVFLTEGHQFPRIKFTAPQLEPEKDLYRVALILPPAS